MSYNKLDSLFLPFWACPSLALGSACYGLRFASVLRCAPHC
ncbi:MAG: hypothetical protein NZ455_03505 [Bacteroidia bacterium]|nr:hypothetical protein [Bacteroidia bacterium]